jgi:hypothetical protein
MLAPFEVAKIIMTLHAAVIFKLKIVRRLFV